MRFVDIEKAFDIVPRKGIKRNMRKKCLSEEMVGAVMSLYDGTKTGVGSVFSEEFEIKAGSHQGSVLLLLLFTTIVDVIAKMQEEL